MKRIVFSETKEMYYTAGEAAERLKISKNAFYYMVKKEKLVKGVILPLRKQAVYRKRDIDKLAEARGC